MCRKTMRPTNVRASVGSSASGSSASAIVSVPPALLPDETEPAAPEASSPVAASTSAAPRTLGPRLRIIVIFVASSSVPGNSPGEKVWAHLRAHRAARTLPFWIHPRSDWIQPLLRWARVGRPSPWTGRGRRASEHASRADRADRAPAAQPQGASRRDRACRRLPLGPTGRRRRRDHGAAARALGPLRTARGACGFARRDHPDQRRRGADVRRGRRDPRRLRRRARPRRRRRGTGGCPRARTRERAVAQARLRRVSGARRRGDGGQRLSSVALLLALVAVGAASGMLAGLLGVGGGILLVPFLALAVGMSQHEAEATSLLVVLPTAVVASFTLWRRGVGDLPSALGMGVVGAIGAAAGALFALSLPGGVLRTVFAVFLGLVGLRLVRDALLGGAVPE